ncbi:hypothetical protein CSW30_12105, partial [Thermus scotoductus]
MRREDHFRPFSSWLSDLEREVARCTQAVPLFSGITAQGWPYCPGVGRLSASFRVPGAVGPPLGGDAGEEGHRLGAAGHL